MTDIEYKVADLINFSSNQKPIEFEQAFKSVIAARVSDAIEAKKAAVAQSMFASNDDHLQDDEDQEDLEVEDEAEEEVNAEVA